MTNYKNIKFPNSLNGFKAWCNEFPNMFKDEVLKTCYYQAEKDGISYYMEINKVHSFLSDRSSPKKWFLGVGFRKYEPEQQDFIITSLEEKEICKTLFYIQAKKFCDKNDLTTDFYKEFWDEEEEGEEGED